MPAGHNGSYHDPETPIRNTAHWIVSFAKAYEISKDENFYNAILQGLKSIKDAKWRPTNSAFFCRKKESKDKCQKMQTYLKVQTYLEYTQNIFVN